MGWGNGAKEFFEEYRQRYLNDGRKIVGNFRTFIEKIETRATRVAYQPYKWLVAASACFVYADPGNMCHARLIRGKPAYWQLFRCHLGEVQQFFYTDDRV